MEVAVLCMVRGSVVMASLLVAFAAAVGAAAQRPSPMCAIDMGSNSFRRIVGSFENGRYSQRRIDQRTLGVGDDVARNGRISDAKLADIRKTLSEFARSCKADGASPVKAVGTAAFRDAPNGKQAVDIAAALGISMEIATEPRESELAYLVGSLGRDGYAVVDNGSRSIELVARDRGALRHHVFNLGYRIAYETFFASAADPASAVQALRERVRRESAQAPYLKGQQTLVGVEFGEMAQVLFEPAAVEGRVFTLAQLQQKLKDVTSLPATGFQALKKTKDIDRALPRLVVAATVMEELGYSQITLTARELGAGLIIEAGR